MGRVLNAEYDKGRLVDFGHKQVIVINGKKYLDFSMSGGVHLFGHSPEFLKKRLVGDISNGTAFAYPHKIHEEFLESLNKHVKFRDVVFCNSGSEAVMRAFRIARCITGRKEIVIFKGSWHGSYDDTVYFSNKNGVYAENVKEIEYDACELDRICPGKTAMIFIEPFQGSNPYINRPLIEALRKYCDENDILLGFDEIISGIRTDSRRIYGIRPDISTYGKVVGGGFPIGIVTLSKHYQLADKVFLGGTFSGNPITLSAGNEVLKNVNENVLMELDAKAEYLKCSIDNHKKLSVIGVGSFLRLLFTKSIPESRADRDRLEDLELRKKTREVFIRSGIHVGSNGLLFLSTEHTKSDINRIIEVLFSIK
jgi:glutamate-1-semialdehyde 2,1-aminomutase